jgi:dTDP-4-dehydrorhamnose reductase
MILVTGAGGMLGSDLLAELGDRGRGVDLGDMDITSAEDVERVLTTVRPRVVVNCAAYTDVDGCETNLETAMLVNGTALSHLAAATTQNRGQACADQHRLCL